MGASSRMFIKLRMEEEQYAELPQGIRNKMESLGVDEKNPSYPDDDCWVSLKQVFDRAYKDLKKREYILRMNNHKQELWELGEHEKFNETGEPFKD